MKERPADIGQNGGKSSLCHIYSKSGWEHKQETFLMGRDAICVKRKLFFIEFTQKVMYNKYVVIRRSM